MYLVVILFMYSKDTISEDDGISPRRENEELGQHHDILLKCALFRKSIDLRITGIPFRTSNDTNSILDVSQARSLISLFVGSKILAHNKKNQPYRITICNHYYFL